MRPSRPAPRPPRAAAKCSGASRGRLWAPEAAGSSYKSAGETYPKIWLAAARTGAGNRAQVAPVQKPVLGAWGMLVRAMSCDDKLIHPVPGVVCPCAQLDAL